MAFLDTVARHPNAVLISIALLVVAILVLAFFIWHYKEIREAKHETMVCGRPSDPSAMSEAEALTLADGGRAGDFTESARMWDLPLMGKYVPAPYSVTSV